MHFGGSDGDRTATRQPASSSMIRPVSGLPDRWTVDRLLGRGGQADVWLARDRELNELVAVKVFREAVGPETHRRIRTEVGIGRRLVHPRLVRVYELIEAGDRLAVAMEWVPGGSVADRLAAGQLALPEVVAWGEQVLVALAFLHEQRVVHRDVKPSNMLIDAAGGVRLADLGLARLFGQGADTTLTVGAVGTPQYMSPEQIRGERAGPPSDLYSLGVALYQMLAGEMPFSGGSDFSVARRHVEQVAPDVRRVRSDCPVWLAAFVKRLLEKSPRDRFPDGAAAVAAFRRHRVVLPPRLLRRGLVGVALLGLAAVVALRAVPALRDRLGATTVSVESEGTVARGVDAKGRELWRYVASQPIQQVLRVDTGGDSRWEWALAAYPKSRRRAASRGRSEIAIVDHRGTILHRIQPESIQPAWAYATLLAFNPQLRPADLDGDGKSELIAVLISRDSYLSTLAVYWPESGRWDGVVNHSGYIEDMVVVPGAPPQLRFLAFNSNLGMTHAVGQVSFNPDGDPSFRTHDNIARSPDSSELVSRDRFSLDWYVPLPQIGTLVSQPAFLGAERGGATRLVHDGEEKSIDRWGNPVPGPNAGRDLARLRREFFTDCLRLRTEVPRAPAAESLRLFAEVTRRYQPLLEEMPYRVALAGSAARAFYDAGDPGRATEILSAAAEQSGCEDILYRLAMLEVFRNNADRAKALLNRVAASHLTPAGDYRSLQALMFMAAESGDTTFQQSFLRNAAVSELGIRVAYEARSRLWRDRSQPGDGEVESWDYVPEGDAVACLVRWRLGRLYIDDADRMARFERENPDMTIPAAVARAAAILGAGRAGEALLLLDGLPSRVDIQEPDAYMLDRFRILGAALRVKALDEAGKRSDAVAEGQRLRPTLRDGLLPAILVDEVLRGGP